MRLSPRVLLRLRSSEYACQQSYSTARGSRVAPDKYRLEMSSNRSAAAAFHDRAAHACSKAATAQLPSLTICGDRSSPVATSARSYAFATAQSTNLNKTKSETISKSKSNPPNHIPTLSRNLPPTRARYHRTTSTPSRSISPNGSTTFPSDFDIFALFAVQWEWESRRCGGGRESARRNAGK